MEIYISLISGFAMGMFLAYGWLMCDIEYYRDIIYAYECQKTRELLH